MSIKNIKNHFLLVLVLVIGMGLVGLLQSQQDSQS